MYLDESTFDFDALDGSMTFDNSESHQSHDSIKVLVRVRPLLDASGQRLIQDESITINSGNSLVVMSNDQRRTHSCSFDAVLGPDASQAEVYEVVKDCTASVLQGVNCTIFAYGQTGSGKTHSMYGPPNYITASTRDTESLGVIPRAIHHIFELSRNSDIQGFQVHCSFVQIYNENLFDMLRDGAMNTPLTIREDKKEIYVQGLSEYNVKSVSDTLHLLKIAEDNRAVRETYMNQFSSRSHSIFQIVVEYKKVVADGEIMYKAKFNLVDLAGSEKWDTRKDLLEEHIAEMTNINLSLTTLGRCIAALAKAAKRKNKPALQSESSIDLRGSLDKSINTTVKAKKEKISNSDSHIPYRESKLTRLLQDSLGGAAKTFLIATVSPAKFNCEETISTLKFADRAKQVMVQAIINEFRPVDHALVKRLQAEVELLKSLLKKVIQHTGTDPLRPLLLSDTSGDSNHHVISDTERQYLLRAVKEQSGFSGSGLLQSGLSSGRFSPANMLSGPQEAFDCTAKLRHSMNRDSSNAEVSSTGETGLEYVISLERALNKEQVHAQHLARKNETLIKELEDLRFQNMQLTFQSKTEAQKALSGEAYSGQGNAAYQMQSAAADVGQSNLYIPEEEVTQVIGSVKTLIKQNEELSSHTDAIQKIMRKFFKFQIEEEDMKVELNKVFDALKHFKQNSAAQQVNDNFAFLEFLQQGLTSQQKSYGLPKEEHGTDLRSSRNALQPSHASRASSTSLPMPVQMAVGGGAGAGAVDSGNAVYSSAANMSGPSASFTKYPPTQEPLLSVPVKKNKHAQSLPDLSNTTSVRAPNKSGSSKARYSAHQEDEDLDEANTLIFDQPQQPITFRVRGAGGMSPKKGPRQSQAPSGANEQVSGWLQESQVVSMGDAENEEEELRKALKEAKKRQKQKEKLEAWMKEKEEKALQEQRIHEEEKRAMAEIERERENKRREYAQKQKQKLSSYMDKVKSEAEKIQELINLGIDPKSFM